MQPSLEALDLRTYSCDSHSPSGAFGLPAQPTTNSIRSRIHSVSCTAFLLAPEISTLGGVQSYMRRLLAVLCTLPENRGRHVGLSLTDDTASQCSCGRHYVGTAKGSKFRFLYLSLLTPSPTPAVVISGHPALSPVGLLLRATGLAAKHIVVTHGIEAWDRASPLVRLAMRSSDTIVTTTTFTANVCSKVNHIPRERFRVIPLCAEEPPSSAIRSSLSFGPGFHVLTVGRMAASERYKGFDTLLAAAAALVHEGLPVYLHVVGDGDDRPRLEGLARAVELGQHVRFYGKLSDADLQAAYSHCDVFAMPSMKEGFGIVFLEAMRHAKPCIGGAHGGTPEVIEHGHSGFLVQYGDVAALASHIARLYRDPCLTKTLGTNGKRQYTSVYSEASFRERWIGLLSDFWNGPLGPNAAPDA